MYLDQDDNYDYTCEICGCGYYAEVGIMIGCGRHTRQEIDAYFEKKRQADAEELLVRRRRKKSYQDLDDIDIQMEDDDMRPY